MSESFLHYIWQFQYFNRHELTTSDNETVAVYQPGMLNHHAGPDFSNARIRIGEIEWIGSVEVHIYSSGWLDHHHSEDDTYENVVLHVVWKNDKPVKRKDGTLIPTLELKDRVDEKFILRYRKLINSPESIPCAKTYSQVDEIARLSMADKALMGRLEEKAVQIMQLLNRNNTDWEETAYQTIFRNFGFKVNAEPFLQLAQSLPYKILLKHADKLQQVESLLFGLAGFLEDDHDEEYFQLLKREYTILQQKYQLSGKQLNKTQWKFLRMRPANFPTIRIAQLASLICQRKNIFSRILEAGSYKQLVEVLHVVQSPYWLTHYQFSKLKEENIPGLGQMSIENIIINSVVPLLAAYGKMKDEQHWTDRAVNILQHLPAEQNAITRKWLSVGQPVKSAFDSQAFLQLHNHYCLKKRCLDCNIGARLIKPGIV